MNIGYFGGSFDPIHTGHLALARAAQEACRLDRVLFVPTDLPPHKRARPLTPFIHRFTMVALALAEAGEAQFVPSLLERPRGRHRFRYSIETLRALRRALPASDRLFFLIGIDAFLDISTWRRPEALLRECEFIVVSRPGYSLAQVTDALPAALRPRTIINRAPRRALRSLRVKGATIHLVEGVNVPVSATDLRAAIPAARSRPGKSRPRDWRSFLPRSVAAYIQQMHLYEVE